MFIVDLGFSAAKWIKNDKKGMVKSCYRKTRGDEGQLFQGERYITGEKALLQTGSHYLRTVEELVRFYPLFVAMCANKAGVKTDDVLVIGLPFDFYDAESLKEKKSVSNAITVLKESLASIDLDGEKYTFKNILVFPQGLGGIKFYLSTLGKDCVGNLLAIDIGFNTVISTLYSCQEHEILTGQTYYKKGIHDLAANLLLPEIKTHLPGKTLTPLEINHVIETGTIQSGFDLINIRPEIDAAASAYVSDLLALVIGDLKAHGGVINFASVLLFGGGARLFEGKVQSSKTKITILAEPEFANAKGFSIKASELNAPETKLKAGK